MVWALQLVDSLRHIVEFDDLVKPLFVWLSIPNCQSYTVFTKSTSPSDSVQVSLNICFRASVLSRHIEIDYELGLWNIDTSGDQISSDQKKNRIIITNFEQASKNSDKSL